MLTLTELRAIAQKIVDISKSTARRDTGFLKRSISYTVENNVFIFVEVFYGQYGTNSKLEKNARRLMPNGVKWRMRYTDINRKTLQDGSIQTGRNSIANLTDRLRQSTKNVARLIAKIRDSGKKENERAN